MPRLTALPCIFALLMGVTSFARADLPLFPPQPCPPNSSCAPGTPPATPPTPPGTLGLEIIRHYNSAFSRPGASTNLIGRGWKLSYETELANLVRVDMPTGSRYYHYEDGHFPTLLTGISELATDPHGRLAWQRVSTYGYDADGRPTCRCAGCPPRQE
jgi:hypothetical protein